MLPLRKFVIFLFLFSVLPVTLVLIWVKLTLSSMPSEKEVQLDLLVSPTLIPTKNEVKQIPLTIFAPVNGATVFEPIVTVKGRTAVGVEVYVNAASSSADLEGNFAVNVPLAAGKNPITVLVRDSSGKYEQMEIEVRYELDKH